MILVWNIGGVKAPRRHKIEEIPEAILTLGLALGLDWRGTTKVMKGVI